MFNHLLFQIGMAGFGGFSRLNCIIYRVVSLVIICKLQVHRWYAPSVAVYRDSKTSILKRKKEAKKKLQRDRENVVMTTLYQYKKQKIPQKVLQSGRFTHVLTNFVRDWSPTQTDQIFPLRVWSTHTHATTTQPLMRRLSARDVWLWAVLCD